MSRLRRGRKEARALFSVGESKAESQQQDFCDAGDLRGSGYCTR